MAGSFTGRPPERGAGRNAARNVEVRGIFGCTSAKRAALRAVTLTAVRRTRKRRVGGALPSSTSGAKEDPCFTAERVGTEALGSGDSLRERDDGRTIGTARST